MVCVAKLHSSPVSSVVEHQTFNLRVTGSNPVLGVTEVELVDFAPDCTIRIFNCFTCAHHWVNDATHVICTIPLSDRVRMYKNLIFHIIS